MGQTGVVRMVVVTRWVSRARSRGLSCEANGTIELLDFSSGDVSCVTAGNGVAVVGSALVLVVEGCDPGKEIGECGSCRLGNDCIGWGAG